MGPASPGGVSTPSNGDPRLFDVAAMGFAFSLAAENLAVATMLGIAATMAPLALAGLATWALSGLPDADALLARWRDRQG